MKVTLWILGSDGERTEHPVTRSVTVIGRAAACDLHVNDSRISRRHCMLYVSSRHPKVKVVDLSSATGTIVNGHRVRESRLKDGDLLLLGRVQIQVAVSMTPEETAALEAENVPQAVQAPQPIEEMASTLAGQPAIELGSPDDAAADLVRLDDDPAVGGRKHDRIAQGSGTEERVSNAESAGDPSENGAVNGGGGPSPGYGQGEGKDQDQDEGRDQGQYASDAGRTGGIDDEDHHAGREDRGRRRPARGQEANTLPVVHTPHESVIRQEPGIFDVTPAGPAPAPASHNVSLGMLLHYKWTILVTFLLIAAPAVTAVWMLIQPKYSSRAEIRVKPIIPFLVFKTEDNGQIPLYDMFMNTQVSIIRSPTLLQRVLDQPEVQKTAWYNEKPPFYASAPPTPVERLRDMCSASPRGRTEIMDVTTETLDPADAAAIANALLDQYLKYFAEALDQNKDTIYRKLAEEYKALDSEIEGREKILAKLRKELGTSIPEELIAKKRVRLDEIEARIEAVRRELVNATWLEGELSNMIRQNEAAATQPASRSTSRPASQPAGRPNYQSDYRWQELVRDITAMRLQVETESKRMKAAHPKMIEMQRKALAAEELIKAREVELDKMYRENLAVEVIAGKTESALQKELAELHRKIKQSKNEEKVFQEDAQKQKVVFESAFETAEMLGRENDAIKRKREVHAAVRTRIEQKDMEKNVPGSIEVISRAMAASRPSSDRRIVFTMMVLALGLGAGVALAFFRAMMSQAIRRAEDLPLALRTPFLGQVPLLATKRGARPEDSPLFREGIRMVRTALLSRLPQEKGTLVQVTSAGSRAGKTTVCLGLARSLAEGGLRVLLIEADLRNPSLSRRLGISPVPGFVGSLVDEVPDDLAIIPGDTPRLSVLPAGNRPEGADLEYIANGSFTACLSRWRRTYDIILLDSPPILPVADARILARKADGTIMVVREETCRRSEVIEALACLGGAGGHLLGTVFVSTNSRNGYYHYDSEHPAQA